MQIFCKKNTCLTIWLILGGSALFSCYALYMTEADVIAHWRKGAQDALEAAELLHRGKKYALALFNLHLAVEKALKAQYMEECRKEAPPTHDLFLIAKTLTYPWTAEQERQLGYLTEYAIASRYDDPHWAEHEATQENSTLWLSIAKEFLSSLLP